MEWISVKDRLPEFTGDFGGFALVSDDVVAYSKSRRAFFADYSTQGWCDENGETPDGVTHWMPLPPAPEIEK
jgi:hypothetical protein